MRKSTFSLAAMKFCNSMHRATTADPTQTHSGCESIRFKPEKILFLFHRKTVLCCMSIFFHVKMKYPHLDQNQKRCVSEIPFQNLFEAGNQLNASVPSQSALSNNAFLIAKIAPMHDKENFPLSQQSAFSNFAPYN